MRPATLLLLIGITMSLLAIIAAPGHGQGAASPTPSPPGFALAELFTSEGCSSCPPADDVLARIDEAARREGQPVHTLAFHVDYWDNLGWKDPFSAAFSTRRQREYARVRGTGRVYTPQLIVNGCVEFVGSDQRRAVAEVKSAIARGTPVRIDARVTAGKAGDQLTVTWSTIGAAPAHRLNIALVQKSATVQVANGENAGRTLRHVNVVRDFKEVPLKDGPAGETSLTLPVGLAPANVSIVLYIQDTETLGIVGATTRSAREDGDWSRVSSE